MMATARCIAARGKSFGLLASQQEKWMARVDQVIHVRGLPLSMLEPPL